MRWGSNHVGEGQTCLGHIKKSEIERGQPKTRGLVEVRWRERERERGREREMERYDAREIWREMERPIKRDADRMTRTGGVGYATARPHPSLALLGNAYYYFQKSINLGNIAVELNFGATNLLSFFSRCHGIHH